MSDISLIYSICAVICIVILFGMVVLFICHRGIFKKWFQPIPIIGIFLAGFFAYLPLFNQSGNTAFSFGIFDSIISSAQMFILARTDINLTVGLISTEIDSGLIIIYQILFTVLLILAPLCTMLVIISLLSDWLSYIRIHFLLRISDRYVFSDLNEKTVALAKSMINKKIHGYYIFCGVKREERKSNPYFDTVKELGCTVVASPITKIPPSQCRNTEYYIISEDGNENVEHAMQMMEQLTPDKILKKKKESNADESKTKSDDIVKSYITIIKSLLLSNEINELRCLKEIYKIINNRESSTSNSKCITCMINNRKSSTSNSECITCMINNRKSSTSNSKCIINNSKRQNQQKIANIKEIIMNTKSYNNNPDNSIKNNINLKNINEGTCLKIIDEIKKILLLELHKEETNKNHEIKSNKIKIYVTSNEIEAEYLLDKKTEELKNNKLKSNPVNIRHINETQLMAFELLNDNPMFEVLNLNSDKNKINKINFLLIGGGYTGLEVLKNAIWCSTSNIYDFSATVLDLDIKRSESLFMRSCPYLKSGCKDLGVNIYVNFSKQNINAETDELTKFIQNNKYKNFNYIVIATNNDEINIKAALDLKKIYNQSDDNKKVNISVVIRSEQKYNLINKIRTDESKDNSKVNIFPFGCSLRMYSYDKLVNSKLEKMAVCVNWVYENTYKKCNGKSIGIDENNYYIASENSYSDAMQMWRKLNLQKKRSSMALAVFTKYFMWSNNLLMIDDDSNQKPNNSGDKPESVDLVDVEKYSVFSEGSDEFNKSSRLEHERWNTYSLIEGFKPWKYEKLMHDINNLKRMRVIENILNLQKGKKITKDQNDVMKEVLDYMGFYVFVRDENKYQHGCIESWEHVKDIDNKLMTNYINYDEEFIKHMPRIIDGFGNKFGYRYRFKLIEDEHK